MTTQALQTETPAAAAASIVYMPVAPRTPTPFHGETYEDIEDWIVQYDRVARHNGWTDQQRQQNLYIALENTVKQRV